MHYGYTSAKTAGWLKIRGEWGESCNVKKSYGLKKLQCVIQYVDRTRAPGNG